MKVNWVNNKSLDINRFNQELQKSLESNQLTNYGPAVQRLEKLLTALLEIDEDRCLIVTSNGSSAMHALVSGINLEKGNRLTYATQAFTFPTSCQGSLKESNIVDIDRYMGLNLDQIEDDIDGIVVTNLFGNVTDIDKYEQWAKENDKILIFDNATVSYTFYKGRNAVNYGNGCIVSLHHTKPIGFGEGGIIVAKKKYEQYIRRCINFGFSIKEGRVCWSREGSNFKMSDISAASIITYLDNFKEIAQHNKRIYSYFLEKAREIPYITIFPDYSDGSPFVSCIPIILNKEVTEKHLYHFQLSNIIARKYYVPLESKKIADEVYSRILCLPCHIEITEETIDKYLSIIDNLFS